MEYLMLKKRIIPVQLLLNNRLVKTKAFNNYIDVGNPVKSSKIYSDADADELVFLNIERENSKVCFMPLALGGGIKTIDDMKILFRNGADKVIVNSSVYQNYSLIKEASLLFGKQSIIISVDTKKNLFIHRRRF